MKKLKSDYRKIKDKHNKTGRGRLNWRFFDALNSVLGHKPATKPPVVLDTSEDHAELDASNSDMGTEEEDDLLTLENSLFSSSTTTVTNTSITRTGESSNSEQPPQASEKATASGIRGKK